LRGHSRYYTCVIMHFTVDRKRLKVHTTARMDESSDSAKGAILKQVPKQYRGDFLRRIRKAG
jgi:hypothetical protein